MTSSANSSSTGSNMSEAWLIKALRLLHSQKPEDTARLRKLYKDICENESAATRITIAEALRTEPSGMKEESNSGSERGVVRPRISAPSTLISSESSSSDATQSATVSTVSSKNRSPLNTANMPIIPVVVCQGKAIITEQSSPVVMTTPSGLGSGGNGSGGEVNSPPVEMEVMEDLVADLMCCVCGRMIAAVDQDVGELPSSSAKSRATNNVLVECTRCRGLYHQLCHSPPLLTARVPTNWVCSRCSVPSPSRRRVSTSPSDSTTGLKKPKN